MASNSFLNKLRFTIWYIEKKNALPITFNFLARYVPFSINSLKHLTDQLHNTCRIYKPLY